MPPRGQSLPTGKLPASLLRELLASSRSLPPEVLLGPAPGEDAAAIRVAGGVLVAATDPITFTGRGIGRYAVIINANDIAVRGVRPRWFLCTALLPPGTGEQGVRRLFAEVEEELARLGAALVGGHTEVTAAVTQPVVVGAFFGVAEDGRFLRTGGLSPGDAMVQIGAVPVEGAAVHAAECRERLEHLPAEVIERAAAALRDPGISVVQPALAAATLGATSLHDPTEGGLATALWEVAEAGGLALEVDPDAVLWFEPGLQICSALGADPWGTLASGALLAAFPPDRLQAALEGLRAEGYSAVPIGKARQGRGVRTREGESLPRFEADEVARLLVADRG